MTTHAAKRWHEAVDARTWRADATPCKRAPVAQLRSREPPPCRRRRPAGSRKRRVKKTEVGGVNMLFG